MKRLDDALQALISDEPLCAYIYDLAALRDHSRAMTGALPPNAELFYAAKANPDARILDALRPIVDGFEAASGGEFQWLQACQPDMPLIFGGPGKLKSELTMALEKGVESIHVESQTELLRLAHIADKLGCQAPVLLRMNIALDGIATTRLTMGGKPTPFGFDVSELGAALAVIAGHPQLTLKGFHFHLLSHQLCDIRHIQLMKLYFRTFKQWCARYSLDVSVLNVGGGMGINYIDTYSHFNWSRFCEKLHQLIALEEMEDTTIRFECGRFVASQCGYYAMEVLDIKANHGEYFAVCRGGTHHFRTPAAQGHSHPFFIVHGKNREKPLCNTTVSIVGQLCTPKDILAQRPVDSLAIGDYVIFPLAGAYAWNISHQNFLMHPPPLVHYINE
ncbi:type III PLP-dependent enzyme [Zhongshania sp.]|uniref:type III PLP-dependent enzyme n=1 Tax=Zhongshania sp. TaxID=1971902 RepID=UPI0035617BDD